MNISQALVNPEDAGSSPRSLRLEVAGILYDCRMIGAKVVRWLSTDVWPQWRCGTDPEDQSSGEIDPAWFEATQALLEEAQRQHLKVVIALADLAAPGFAPTTTDALKELSLHRRWATYRRDMTGKDKYQHGPGTECSRAVGYYGHLNQAAIFADPATRKRLIARFVKMSRFLVSFPALSAIELFNEPGIQSTQTIGFWLTVSGARQAIHQISKQATTTPIFSGALAWSWSKLGQAVTPEDLDQEAMITEHSYRKFDTPADDQTFLNKTLQQMHKLAPGKPAVISEIGGSGPITDIANYERMLNVIMTFYTSSDAGVWVWGSWFAQPNEDDFSKDFNHRSRIGSAFRTYFFADIESEFAEAQAIPGTDPETGAVRSASLSIEHLSDTEVDPWRRSAWRVALDKRGFVGFSRAGVFSRPHRSQPGLFGEPPPTLFISERDQPRQWLQIAYTGRDWELILFDCAGPTTSNSAKASLTPIELLGLSVEERRADFSSCTLSVPRFKAHLRR